MHEIVCLKDSGVTEPFAGAAGRGEEGRSPVRGGRRAPRGRPPPPRPASPASEVPKRRPSDTFPAL